MSATADLIDFAGAPHRLPAAIRAEAIRLLGDTLAVAAAGAVAPGAADVARVAQRWGNGNDARLIGGGGRLPAPAAAFVNGFRIHCLEWDAVHEPAVVHAMSVVTAALAAAIDRRGGCSPDDALTALAVGVDIACGLGLAATSPLSFFRPATAGCIGAAIAVARIEGVRAVADVIGLAYSQCAGTMQAHVEGSIALPLQIAVAARAAVTAVDLAAAGLAGPHDALEGPFGYFRLFDRGELATYTATLGTTWRIGEISVKPFASGRASHGLLQGLDELMRQATPDQIVGVTLHAPPLVHRLVGREWRGDMTPSYARLCGPFLGALFLTDRQIDPRRFVPEAFGDPMPRALGARIAIRSDGNPDPNALAPQRMVAELEGGRRIEIDLPQVWGSPAAPLPDAVGAAKYGLARTLAGPECDARLFDAPLAYLTEPR